MSSILTADYAGRKFDVLALRGYRPAGDVLLTQDALADGGQICVGIIKLSQWFVAELLTARGSVAYDPTRGTDLYTKLANSRLRTETDVFVAFGFAVGDVKATASLVEPADAPADERFADAVLLAVAIAPGFAQLTVALSSQAGTSRRFIVPVPTGGGR